jgi:hypothetical protein
MQTYGDQEKHRMKLVWKLDDDGAELWQWVTASLHPASNFYKVAESLLLTPPPNELDVEDLFGKRCWVTVQYRTSQDTGKKYANVVNCRPFLPEDGAPKFSMKTPESKPLENKPGVVRKPAPSTYRKPAPMVMEQPEAEYNVNDEPF